MSGFRGGESTRTVIRKQGNARDAQQRWGVLTCFDRSAIKNSTQLASMVEVSVGISEAPDRNDLRLGCAPTVRSFLKFASPSTRYLGKT